MSEAIAGARIRERRRQMGVTQAEMARRIGISPSYLNLIERNRRRITPPLLHRAAEALGLRAEDLDGAIERRLIDGLRELATRPGARAFAPEAEQASDLVARFPGWARLVAALAQSERKAQDNARALNDRLTHDPFLGETVHRMLSRTAAIRSAAEILTEFGDLSADDRDRFHGILQTETQSLGDVSEALAEYFDGFEASDRMLTPLDEMDALFDAHANRFAFLEHRAEDLHARLTGHGLNAAASLAAEALEADTRAHLDTQPGIATAAGRARCQRALEDYAALAILLPLSAIAPAAREAGYDAQVLARDFDVPLPEVFRRLTALPPDDGHPAFAYLSANASGSLRTRLTIDGLPVPRHTPACPLWRLFHAQAAPDTLGLQHAVFPNGEAFVFVVHARNTAPPGFGQVRHMVGDMLALPLAAAERTVYGASLPGPEPVGLACRLCPRTACPHRVEDPFLG